MSAVASPRHAQWMTALERANEAREDACLVKREVAAGGLSLAAAMDDPRAGSIKIIELLVAQRRWGRTRARALLGREMISPERRVRELTERQRRVLGEATP